MNGFELGAALVLAALGVRSALAWARRPFRGADLTDHLLYALALTGRVGLWFAFAGIFLLFGTSDAEGRAFIDEMRDQRWLVVVIAVLGVAQFLGGFLLARRAPARGDEREEPEGAGRTPGPGPEDGAASSRRP